MVTPTKAPKTPAQNYFQREYQGELDAFEFDRHIKIVRDATIHFGKRKVDGKLIVLKEFTGNREEEAEAAKQSLRDGITTSVYPHPLFANPVYVPQNGNGYIVEYIPGYTVQHLLRKNMLWEFETYGRVIVAYATIMKHVHEKNWLMGDNNWGAVIVTENGARIIDLDAIAPREQHNNPAFPFFVNADPNFFSKEQGAAYLAQELQIHRGITLTPTSELESFAMMIEALYNKGNGMMHGPTRKRSAKLDEIPKNILSVIEPILRTRRILNCTIDDFIAAAKLDFGL